MFHLQGQKGQDVLCVARVEGTAEPQEPSSPPKRQEKAQREDGLHAWYPSNLNTWLDLSIILSDTQSVLENASEFSFIQPHCSWQCEYTECQAEALEEVNSLKRKLSHTLPCRVKCYQHLGPDCLNFTNQENKKWSKNENEAKQTRLGKMNQEFPVFNFAKWGHLNIKTKQQPLAQNSYHARADSHNPGCTPGSPVPGLSQASDSVTWGVARAPLFL